MKLDTGGANENMYNKNREGAYSPKKELIMT